MEKSFVAFHSIQFIRTSSLIAPKNLLSKTLENHLLCCATLTRFQFNLQHSEPINIYSHHNWGTVSFYLILPLLDFSSVLQYWLMQVPFSQLLYAMLFFIFYSVISSFFVINKIYYIGFFRLFWRFISAFFRLFGAFFRAGKNQKFSLID